MGLRCLSSTGLFPASFMNPLILVHDYLIQMGGAERVLAAMARRHPHAPIYASAVDPQRMWPVFADRNIHTTWMQHLPGMPGRFKHYFPLYPSAFRSFGQVACEVAWISASTFSKCLRLPSTSVSVCYCHNPTRFLWQTDEYLAGEIRNGAASQLARATFPWLRFADRQAAQRMDLFVANSQSVRQRIRRFYGREARVVHPPVELSRFTPSQLSQNYWLIVSRLVGYKRIDRAVEAFNKLGKRLIIVGEGPDRARLESMAAANITFTGLLPDDKVRDLMMACRALVFPGEEDFGITPVEAQACGKPVIAWARGGALETVRNGETGLFFKDGNAEALADAVAKSEAMIWDPLLIRDWAENFSEERFLRLMADILDQAREEHRERLRYRVHAESASAADDPISSASFCANSRN